jgi:phosphohistidine phosphatase
MKQIYILRHAKSSWDNKDLADFDRPLSNRGENDAKKLCSFLKKINGIVIDKVMCSNAKRTKETFDLVADGFNFPIADAFYTEDLIFWKM